MDKEQTLEPLSQTKSLVLRPVNALTKAHLDKIQLKEKIRVIQRRSKISAANEWVSFGVSKSLGAGGLVLGGLEWLDPNYFSIVVEKPEIMAGIGIAFLAGKSVISLIAKAAKVFGE